MQNVYKNALDRMVYWILVCLNDTSMSAYSIMVSMSI